MSAVGDFVGNAVGSIVGVTGDITGATAAGEAGQAAADAQSAAAGLGIEEQRRQFDAITELMSPFVTAGTGALQAQQNLAGLGGAGAQEQAIQALLQGPQFQALTQQSEEALLQNASATGGLRGGNTQGALAQLRPQMLSQLIESQYGKLGGLTQLGQSAAAGQASAGQQTGTNIANLLGQQGAAQAGGLMAQGNVQQQAFGNIMSVAGAGAGFFG